MLATGCEGIPVLTTIVDRRFLHELRILSGHIVYSSFQAPNSGVPPELDSGSISARVDIQRNTNTASIPTPRNTISALGLDGSGLAVIQTRRGGFSRHMQHASGHCVLSLAMAQASVILSRSSRNLPAKQTFTSTNEASSRIAFEYDKQPLGVPPQTVRSWHRLSAVPCLHNITLVTSTRAVPLWHST